MSLKHTPGPWTMFSADAVFPRYGFPVEAANGRSIAHVTYFRDVDPHDVPAAPREETRANAVLIAAAPDLAAVCRPALTKATIDRLSNLAEAAIAIGDRKDGAALAMLIEWHERARAAYLKIGGADA